MPAKKTDKEVKGTISIHENVLSSLTARTISKIPGVLRLSGSSFIDTFADLVNTRKVSDRSISISVKDENVEIEIRVVALYGSLLPELAAEIRKKVTKRIEEATGMTVSAVNVLITELDDEDREEETPEEDAEDADSEPDSL